MPVRHNIVVSYNSHDRKDPLQSCTYSAGYMLHMKAFQHKPEACGFVVVVVAVVVVFVFVCLFVWVFIVFGFFNSCARPPIHPNTQAGLTTGRL